MGAALAPARHCALPAVNTPSRRLLQASVTLPTLGPMTVGALRRGGLRIFGGMCRNAPPQQALHSGTTAPSPCRVITYVEALLAVSQQRQPSAAARNQATDWRPQRADVVLKITRTGVCWCNRPERARFAATSWWQANLICRQRAVAALMIRPSAPSGNAQHSQA